MRRRRGTVLSMVRDDKGLIWHMARVGTLHWIGGSEGIMNQTRLLIVGAALGLMAMQAASAQDAKTVLSDAQKAMGPLKTVDYSGSGADFVLGQAFSPSEAWPKF